MGEGSGLNFGSGIPEFWKFEIRNLMMRTWLVGCLVIDGGGGLMFQLDFGSGISEIQNPEFYDDDE